MGGRLGATWSGLAAIEGFSGDGPGGEDGGGVV